MSPTASLRPALLAVALVGLTTLGACGRASEPKAGPADAAASRPVDAAAAVTATLDAAAPAARDAAPGATATREDPEVGPAKDLQALPKSWDRKQVTAFMRDEIERGTGTPCADCHDESDWAKSDNKRYPVARQMIQLVDHLNTTYFKGKPRVTCFTCHHGKNEP